MAIYTPELSYAFNEGAGNTINPTHGEAVGVAEAAAWRAGQLAGAPDFALDRTSGLSGSQRVTVVSDLPADVNLWTEFTVMLGVRPVANGGDGRFPVAFYSNPEAGGDWLGMEMASGGGVSWWLGSNNLPASATAVANGVWHHHALTWDGAMIRSYIDGVLARSAAAATGIAALARITLNGADWMAAGGGLDNFRLINKTLTAAEILEAMPIAVGDEPAPTPLATPTVTITDEVDPTTIGGTDGQIHGIYTPSANAGRHEIGVRTGHGQTTGFLPVDADGPTPFAITNRPAGQFTVGVRAHPAE